MRLLRQTDVTLKQKVVAKGYLRLIQAIKLSDNVLGVFHFGLKLRVDVDFVILWLK